MPSATLVQENTKTRASVLPSHDVTAPEKPVQAVGELVLRERAELATTLVSMEFGRHPELIDRYGESARTKSLQDTGDHLSYLAAALFADNPELFVDYVGWAKVALANRGVLPADLLFNLRCMCDALRFELPLESAEMAIGFVSDAIERFPSLPDEIPAFIQPEHPHASLADQYLQSLIRGDRKAASRLILDAVEEGVRVRDIYLHVFQRTQYEIGRLWQTNQISVAREHFCSAVTQAIMSQLYPHLVADQKTGRVVVTTCVAGDQHEIGVRMVTDFFEMAGWDNYYLGANTPTASVISELIERKADVLGISATIACHVSVVAELIRAVRATAECSEVKILVGGHPFRVDRDLWTKVGADGDALDAESAIDKAGTWFDACRHTL